METAIKTRRRMRTFSAREKSKAVLSVWSGRRRAADVMKELGVPWGILNLWEKRALAGMLKALDPNWNQPTSQENLPLRVERLMTQTFKVETT